MSKRKFNPKYIQYGLVAVHHRREDSPPSVVCMKTLSNGAIKPSFLKRHLYLNHPENKDKDESYFKQLSENANKQSLNKTGRNYLKTAGNVKVTYEVSFLVA